MHPIYRVTSVGRPVDPSYPTNRALLWVMPAVALLVAAAELLGGTGAGGALLDGLLAALVVFGTWAVARELAPDDDPAAFLAVAFAVALWWLAPAPNLALLFSALMLTRVVNRSVGVPARLSDTLMILGLVVYTLTRPGGAWLAFVAALAFALDSLLSQPLRRHAPIALLLAAAPLLPMLALPRAPLVPPHAGWAWGMAAVAVLYLVALVRTRQVRATGDVSGEPLNGARVRGGMLIGLLCALQALPAGFDASAAAAPLWAALAGVGVSALRR